MEDINKRSLSAKLPLNVYNKNQTHIYLYIKVNSSILFFVCFKAWYSLDKLRVVWKTTNLWISKKYLIFDQWVNFALFSASASQLECMVMFLFNWLQPIKFF